MKIHDQIVFTGNYFEIPPKTVGTVIEPDHTVVNDEIAVDFGKYGLWAIKKEHCYVLGQKRPWRTMFHSCEKNKTTRTHMAIQSPWGRPGRLASPKELAVCKVCGKDWVDFSYQR